MRVTLIKRCKLRSTETSMWLGGLHIVHIRIVMCLMLNLCNWIKKSGLQGYLILQGSRLTTKIVTDEQFC